MSTIIKYLFARPTLFSIVLFLVAIVGFTKGIMPIPEESKLAQISGIVESATQERNKTIVTYELTIKNDKETTTLEIGQDIVTEDQVRAIVKQPVTAKYDNFILSDNNMVVLEANGQTIIAYDKAKQKIESDRAFMKYLGIAAFIASIVFLVVGIKRRRAQAALSQAAVIQDNDKPKDPTFWRAALIVLLVIIFVPLIAQFVIQIISSFTGS